MNGQLQEIDYALINATGTVIAAIGATPGLTLSSRIKNDLGIVGNALQAAGNALDAEISENLDALGEGTQSFGNSLVIYGSLAPIAESGNLRTIMFGNWLQALGGSLSLYSNLVSDERDRGVALLFIGNLLQIAGNALQAVSTSVQLNDRGAEAKSDQINAIGSWVQALGASLSFLAAFDQISDAEDKTFARSKSAKNTLQTDRTQ